MFNKFITLSKDELDKDKEINGMLNKLITLSKDELDKDI